MLDAAGNFPLKEKIACGRIYPKFLSARGPTNSLALGEVEGGAFPSFLASFCNSAKYYAPGAWLLQMSQLEQ